MVKKPFGVMTYCKELQPINLYDVTRKIKYITSSFAEKPQAPD